MPSVEENKSQWEERYPWEKGGDEWSVAWGGVEMEWYGTILPRLRRYLPVKSMLEIAPGFGRWTQYLKNHAEKLFLVDLAQNCIEQCRRRFRQDTHIEYFQNDGKSLSMIPDRAIDLAFSFDSLVHAEADVIGAYLEQLADKLAPDGVGFIHHSNLGGLKEPPPHGQTHWRARSVSGSLFLELCHRNGLCPISQETWNWGGPFLLDCVTVFTLPDSRFARQMVSLVNPEFMNEAQRLRQLSALYGS